MTRPTTIFIVDDDPFQLDLLSDHLSKMSHYKISTFATGEECLKNMDKNPDVIFLDYYLNSVVKDAMDGLDVLQEIKRVKPDTDVIMLSGQDKIEVAVEVMKYGAFDYIVKGESSFYRAEKAVFNIYRFHKMKKDASTYKKLTYLFGIAFVLLIVTILILQHYKIITGNPGILF